MWINRDYISTIKAITQLEKMNRIILLIIEL